METSDPLIFSLVPPSSPPFIKNKERIIKPIVDMLLNTQDIYIFDSLSNRTNMEMLLDN